MFNCGSPYLNKTRRPFQDLHHSVPGIPSHFQIVDSLVILCEGLLLELDESVLASTGTGFVQIAAMGCLAKQNWRLWDE